MTESTLRICVPTHTPRVSVDLCAGGENRAHSSTASAFTNQSRRCKAPRVPGDRHTHQWHAIRAKGGGRHYDTSRVQAIRNHVWLGVLALCGGQVSASPCKTWRLKRTQVLSPCKPSRSNDLASCGTMRWTMSILDRTLGRGRKTGQPSIPSTVTGLTRHFG